MQTEMNLLPLAAAIGLFIALIQAWVMTMIRYLKLESVRRFFPGYHNLVKSHIDYLMMASLIFATYLILQKLAIQLPTAIIWLIFIGALYNPFGFLLQAFKPDIADGEGYISKVGVLLGFLPLSIGLGWAAIMIIITAYHAL